ncbi:uncharacterized protein LOC112047913 [Bicyclus anynana]|uniref:Uncharacterized protein LOC112047913 n=1 Tax=Bicyclus anynana TaxID=110368 RepID=A0A6J1N7H2_BICAN|nr:uncharacterized protein LOC112047913 [Bicyclus anynana]
MDPRVQCPVCTLYLHSGMSLESHLDTHPKDQVIKALCNLSAKSTGFGSRTPTPHSERSYRSRSRTPATDDGRWAGSHRTSENDRYWRRTPSRNKSTPLSSRTGTPDIRVSNISFENENNLNTNSNQCSDVFTVKSDKTQRTYMSAGQMSSSDYDQRYRFYPEPQEDTEIKYSRSSEYSAQNENSDTTFTYNMPPSAPKPSASIPPPTSRRVNERDFVKILPKGSNIFLKTNVASGMQYITPGANQMHVMMPTMATPQFVQKNVQNNMILTGNLTSAQIHNSKLMAPPMTNQLLTSGTFTPGTTVVTQNSQIIYREMVHNLDAKPFMSSIPAVLGSVENVTNVAQSSAMYQMVVDQFGNTSCMYTTPQHLVPKPCNPTVLSDNMTYLQGIVDKSAQKNNDKTLLIEISPMSDSSAASSSTQLPPPKSSSVNKKFEKPEPKKSASRNSTPGPNKGLKIISNIKVEVPVKHHKNMLNTIMDLTGSGDYTARPISPEKILPDIDDNNQSLCDDSTQPSMTSGDSIASNTFCVINNSSNTSGKESSKSDNKIDSEFSDSCPVPDLICNEKPSISPCSELSEHDNSTDLIITSLKSEPIHTYERRAVNNTIDNKQPKYNPLKINNAFVKKPKKVLQIKNSKFPSTPSSVSDITQSEVNRSDPVASSSRAKSPEEFEINKIHRQESSNSTKSGTLLTVSIEKIKENDDNENNEFDANTEEQSMDIEPVTPSNVNHSSQFTATVDIVQVKEEINTSNDFSNEADRSALDLAPMATLRPINVISCSIEGDFDDDSSHRELLELEASSKNKQFVSMMNENYFGDNIYADYFTPDRVEAFDAEKESHYSKDNNRDGMYIWGEPSQRESEFVLPNFIHESYKIAENGLDYSDMGAEEQVDKCEGDSKADLLSESRSESEAPLNICADEKMPPRGELSGQESNGDMESPWSGMYSSVPPAEPYDLMARESWDSDASDVDTTEKTEPIGMHTEVHFPKSRMYNCALCNTKFPSLKEMRAHKSLVHASPTCSGAKTTYSRLITARAIKKEEKPDPNVLQESLLAMDSKDALAKALPQVFDSLPDTKPPLGLVKQERARRRRDYRCPTCKVDQVTDLAFHAHLKFHPLLCLTCGKCFYRRANLALHLKTHLSIRNYKCEVCEKTFITRQKLSEHHNIHTGRAPVKCTVCDDTFRRYSNMVQHRDRHHLKKKPKVRDFVCGQCGAVFHSRAKLQWHRETHDDKPKACVYCSDKFVHAASLTRHVRRSHNQYFVATADKLKTENVPCPVCKQVYLRPNLRAHLLTHSGKRPYHCHICNKSFTTKWNLKLHRWTHVSRSAKPYKCNLCKGAFIRHTEYVSHMNAHKSVRPYTCKYCGCQFIRKYNCQRHVREHESAKKFVCKVPECGKTFHRSYYLSEHMKVHSGARPFSCHICGKTSSNKSNHNKHVKIHHSREPIATEA